MFAVLSCCLFLAGCQLKTTIRDDQPQAAYRSIFDEDVPSGTTVVNSVHATYSGGSIGTNTTADWEIELLTSDAWIAAKAKKMGLRKIASADSGMRSIIADRIKNRARAWYVPKDLNEYECYYLYLTSIPYVHMLVDRTVEPDGRRRVFLSKH